MAGKALTEFCAIRFARNDDLTLGDLSARQDAAAGVNRRIIQVLFDSYELIVFREPVGSGQ